MGLPPPAGTTRSDHIFHFPDGNASIARLLVRAMIPRGRAGDRPMEDIVTAHFNYARLDERRQRRAAAIEQHGGEGAAPGSDPASGDRTWRSPTCAAARRIVSAASACVLACYNAIIPQAGAGAAGQPEAGLLYGVKTPLVYTNVLIRNLAGVRDARREPRLQRPSAYHSHVFLDFPITLGRYRRSQSPDRADRPAHLVRVPCKPGLPRRDQHRAGRGELLQTTFEAFERRTGDQLGPDPRRRRLQPGQGHPGDHRQPVAALAMPTSATR